MLLFDVIVGDANGGGIFTIDGGGRLRVSHFFKSESKFVACLQSRKRTPSSASAVDARTNSKIAQRVKNAPFNLMGFVVAPGLTHEEISTHATQSVGFG